MQVCRSCQKKMPSAVANTPPTLQHLCGIPVMHCRECKENLSITNIHLHALVTSQSLEEKGFAHLHLSHFILKNAVQFHLQNLFQ